MVLLIPGGCPLADLSQCGLATFLAMLQSYQPETLSPIVWSCTGRTGIKMPILFWFTMLLLVLLRLLF